MAIEVERLIATLEARLDKYEKALKKAAGDGDRAFKRIEDRGKLMETRLAKIGVSGFKGLAVGAAAALAPILSVAAAVDGAKRAMAEFGDVADNARASGLDPEFFQGIAWQAEQGGVAFDQFSGALANFAKNSGLAVAGKGRMVEQLKVLNPALLENIRAATTQEERIRLVADALAAEADASQRAAIATAAFGEAGLKLADVFAGGSAQIDAMQRKAQELGLVVDREIIAKADELGDQFETTTKIVDLQLKQALINLGPILVWLAGLAGNVASALNFVVDSNNPTGQQTLATLEGRLRQLQSGGQGITGKGGTAALEAAARKRAEQLAEVSAEIFRRGDQLSMTKLGSTTPPSTADIPTLEEIETRNEAAKAAVKQGEAVRALIADLQFEQSTIGMSAAEQEVMNTLRRAGVEATSAEGQQIRSLILDLNAQKEAQDRVNESLEQQAELAQSAGRALAQAFEDGEVTGNELLDILADVAKQFALMQLNSLNKGGGGNIFTNILSGLLSGFATGTPNTGGRRGQVRGVVHGQEAVIPLPSGGRVPVEVKAPVGAGALGTGRVTNNVYNYGNDNVETRQNQSGGVDVIIGAVERRIKENMGRGQYRQFGVAPGTRRT